MLESLLIDIAIIFGIIRTKGKPSKRFADNLDD